MINTKEIQSYEIRNRKFTLQFIFLATTMSSETIVTFLKHNVPMSDVPNIQSELKKDFVFAKAKSKTRKKPTKNRVKKCLSRKERKELGFFKIPRDGVKYMHVAPMNKIWLEYITQVLDIDRAVPSPMNKNWESFTQSLYKADFHGCVMEVIRSKCPSYVGKKGICIMDTRNTFKIVSEDDKVTTLPKKECVFDLHLKDLRITLFGKHLCVKPAERSTKKVKVMLHPDL